MPQTLATSIFFCDKSSKKKNIKSSKLYRNKEAKVEKTQEKTNLHINFQDIKRRDSEMGSASTEHSSECAKSIIPRWELFTNSSSLAPSHHIISHFSLLKDAWFFCVFLFSEAPFLRLWSSSATSSSSSSGSHWRPNMQCDREREKRREKKRETESQRALRSDTCQCDKRVCESTFLVVTWQCLVLCWGNFFSC